MNIKQLNERKNIIQAEISNLTKELKTINEKRLKFFMEEYNEASKNISDSDANKEIDILKLNNKVTGILKSSKIVTIKDLKEVITKIDGRFDLFNKDRNLRFPNLGLEGSIQILQSIIEYSKTV